MVKLVGDAQKYWLRNDDDFRVIMLKKASTGNTMMNDGLTRFNKLPNEIKSENNILKFKRLLINYIKMNVNIELKLKTKKFN